MSDNSELQGFTCKRVWEQGYPVLLVWHDVDGEWQFLCGGDEHTSPDEAVLIHARHMFDLKPELRVLADLAAGHRAWRDSIDEPWQTRKADIPD